MGLLDNIASSILDRRDLIIADYLYEYQYSDARELLQELRSEDFSDEPNTEKLVALQYLLVSEHRYEVQEVEVNTRLWNSREFSLGNAIDSVVEEEYDKLEGMDANEVIESAKNEDDVYKKIALIAYMVFELEYEYTVAKNIVFPDDMPRELQTAKRYSVTSLYRSSRK